LSTIDRRRSELSRPSGVTSPAPVAKLLFQSYWVGTRDDILARAERVREAGAKGLIVTLEWVFDSRRDWGSPWIPENLDVKAMLRYAPQVALKPSYLARWVRSGALPDLGVPEWAGRS
jgi:L-lactate dehydrogenase (cytochrome)